MKIELTQKEIDLLLYLFSLEDNAIAEDTDDNMKEAFDSLAWKIGYYRTK